MTKETVGGRKTIAAFGAIMKDETLTPEEKVLWGLYRAYDFKGRGSWPGDETLAGHMGKSVRSVQGYRARLLEKGFLEQTLCGPRPAIYKAVVSNTVVMPGSESFTSRMLGFDMFEDALVALTKLCQARLKGDDEVYEALQEECSELLDYLDLDALNRVLKHKPPREELQREISRQLTTLLKGEKP